MDKKYVEISKLVESLEAVAYSDSKPDSYFSGGFREGLRKAARMLRDEPAADVAPVVHAKWETVAIAIGDTHKACSHCHVGCNAGLWWDFCPKCGARMDA